MTNFLRRPRLVSRLARAGTLTDALLAAGHARADELPADVVAAIRKDYVSPGFGTRLLDGSIDLNGDGKPEIIV